MGRIEKFFALAEHQTTVRTEVAAGVATFLTAAYIIFVNPAILSTTGMDKGALVTITCVITALATLAMGLWPKVPLMIAPGMGLNAFFAFGVCQASGVPWQTALGVVFLSGVLFFLLAVLGIREKILHAIPRDLRLATGVGIGLFIAFIGLKQLGLVVKSEATLVRMGSLSWETGFGILGFLVMAGMEARRIRGSVLIGILFTTLLAAGLGKIEWAGGLVSAPKSVMPILGQLDIMSALSLTLLPTIFAFMYVDLFDSLGTFLAVSRRAGMVRSDGSIPKLGTLLKVDCLATIFGSVGGTSTVTTYIESAVGISQGGRTGLTSVVTGICFLLAIFFAPLVLSVPAYATAPALIIVGIHMVRDIADINFKDWDEGVPAFVTIILMPLTYSIANGIMFGFLAYVLMKLIAGKQKELNLVIVILGILSALNLFLVSQ